MTKDELIEQCARRINKLAWNGCDCDECLGMQAEAREAAREIVAETLTWVAVRDAEAATLRECPANDAGGTADARNGVFRTTDTKRGQRPLSGPETCLGGGEWVSVEEALRMANEAWRLGQQGARASCVQTIICAPKEGPDHA